MLGNRANIFLIEDNELYALMLDQQLKNISNCLLTTYSSAEEAIKHLYLNPDLIILDYHLHGLHGIDAIKELQNKKPKIPIIILSAQKDTQIVVDSLKAGAHNYFTKKKLVIENLHCAINKICSDKILKENNFMLHLVINKQKIFILLLLFGLLSLIVSII